MFDVRISLFGLSLIGWYIWIYQRRNEAFSNFWLKVRKGSSSKVSSLWKCQFSWDVSKQRSKVLIHVLSRGDLLQSSLTETSLVEDLENVKPLVQRASKRGSFEIITQHYHTVLLRQISFQMCRIYLPPYEKIECTNRTSANQYYMGHLLYCPFQNL